jgi:Cu(I)/Ag(I) efflux system membrane protein CusA/SilA
VLLKAQAIATGGYFLDFTVDREAAARYGLRVQDVNDIIESAIGGKTIAMTVEGRERYPINVRYARDFRDDLDSLKRVLVPTPTGAQVPISMLAEISNKTGPPSIRNENAQLVGFVFVDITTADIGGYVKVASERIGKRVRFPPGYYIQWAGQFEYLKAAEKRLAILVPQHEEPGRQTLVESHCAWHRAGKFVLRLVPVSAFIRLL